MNLPQMVPQSTPVTDKDSPLFARVWFMFLNSINGAVATISEGLDSLVASAVIGRGALTHSGVVPKVGAAGALVESAITDDGNTVTITRTPSGAVQPGITLVSTGTVSKARAFRPVTGDNFDLSLNLSFDGTDFNLDDITAAGVLIKFTPSGVLFYFCAAGANPATARVITSAQVSATSVNTTGAYQVGGVQVVGPQQAAVTAPTGGGTTVGAPSGGTVIDVQARTAIGAIITAISSSGNTVDPVARTAINDIRARLAASTGHGLTA